MILSKRMIRNGIDGRGAGNEDLLDRGCPGTCIQHVDRAGDVDVRCLHRMRVAVRDEVDRGQVQGPLGADGCDRLARCLTITDIDLEEPIIPNTRQLAPAEGEIVDNEDLMPLVLEMLSQC